MAMERQDIWQILENKKRRIILLLLYRHQELSFTEIKEKLDSTGSGLAHHLNQLKEAKLVEDLGSKRTGIQPYYSKYRLTELGEAVASRVLIAGLELGKEGWE